MSGGSGESGGGYQYVLLRTYRYLRLGMAVILLLLATSVVVEIVASGTLLGSLSAYYYSPVHSIFIGTLCTVGACLVVYRGFDNLEDATLNASGFLAFVVAFIPIRGEEARPCTPDSGFCSVSEATVQANMIVLLIMGGLALVLGFLVSVGNWTAPAAVGARVAFAVLAAGFIALALFFLLWRTRFMEIGHYVAAIALFVGVSLVVGLNGWRRGRANTSTTGWRRYVNRHTAIFAAMIAAVVVITILGVSGAVDQWIFWLEIGVSLLFAAFWAVQTAESWNDPMPGP